MTTTTEGPSAPSLGVEYAPTVAPASTAEEHPRIRRLRARTKYRRWTKEENDRLKEMLLTNLPFSEIRKDSMFADINTPPLRSHIHQLIHSDPDLASLRTVDTSVQNEGANTSRFSPYSKKSMNPAEVTKIIDRFLADKPQILASANRRAEETRSKVVEMGDQDDTDEDGEEDEEEVVDFRGNTCTTPSTPPIPSTPPPSPIHAFTNSLTLNSTNQPLPAAIKNTEMARNLRAVLTSSPFASKLQSAPIMSAASAIVPIGTAAMPGTSQSVLGSLVLTPQTATALAQQLKNSAALIPLPQSRIGSAGNRQATQTPPPPKTQAAGISPPVFAVPYPIVKDITATTSVLNSASPAIPTAPTPVPKAVSKAEVSPSESARSNDKSAYYRVYELSEKAQVVLMVFRIPGMEFIVVPEESALRITVEAGIPLDDANELAVLAGVPLKDLLARTRDKWTTEDLIPLNNKISVDQSPMTSKTKNCDIFVYSMLSPALK